MLANGKEKRYNMLQSETYLEGKMETKFKVLMKKDDEIMKDFLSFTYRAKGQMNRAKLFVFAAGMIFIGYMAAGDGNVISGNVFALVGIIMILMGLVLPKVALARLKKADEGYNKGTEYAYVFASGSMYVYEDGELAQNVGGYRQVTCFYGDEKNYYVGINNDDLYLLPMKNFAEGDPNDFIEFIQYVSDETYEFLPATLKNRWIKYRVDQKVRDAEYDAKAAAKRAEAAEKKNKKKCNKK